MANRPKVFIGSSAECIDFAKAIHSELESVADPIVWDQGVFRPTNSTLEDLEKLSRSCDYAVFVMSPDDTRTSRGQESRVPRDNILVEFGMFIGALGHSRVFFITPHDEPVELPSDLRGITSLPYFPHRRDYLRAAVSTACDAIRSRLSDIQPLRSPGDSASNVKFWHNFTEREAHQKHVRALLKGAERRVVITGIALNYVILHCENELRGALSKEVPVSLVIANATASLFNYYARYSTQIEKQLPTTHELYRGFFESLGNNEQQSFALYYTDIPLTHSIGLYDDQIYVNEFCIDNSQGVAPSFSPQPGSPSYDIFISELRILLTEGRRILGSATDTLVAYRKAS